MKRKDLIKYVKGEIEVHEEAFNRSSRDGDRVFMERNCSAIIVLKDVLRKLEQ